jgi:hypothetical protein
MLLKGIHTTATGQQILVPIAVSSLGQILTSPALPNSIGATLRTLNGPLLLTNPILQSSFQSAYDTEIGLNAPDAVPAEVINAVIALNNTNWKIYLGHNIWQYTNSTNGTNWLTVTPSKGNFAALVPANHTFTFK